MKEEKCTRFAHPKIQHFSPVAFSLLGVQYLKSIAIVDTGISDIYVGRRMLNM